MDNQTIAEMLIQYAHYLAGRQENLYRIQAYRRAAETVLRLERPIAQLVNEGGRAGLLELPGIGKHLSSAIEGLIRTGEFQSDGKAEQKFAVKSLPINRRLAYARQTG